MGRVGQLIIFLLIVSLVVGVGHFYIWARVFRDTQVSQPWRGVGAVTLILLGLLMFAGPMLRSTSDSTLAAVVIWSGYVWMGMAFVLIVHLLAADFLRLSAGKFGWSPFDAQTLANPERRTFLMRLLASVAGVSAIAVGGFGVRSALQAPPVKRVQVPLRRLPRQLDGFKVIQITDLHVGPTIGAEYTRKVVDLANSLEPDVVAITGDLVDGTVPTLRNGVAPLADLRARYGVYFVTGNHEYYSGADAWIAELERLGIRVLRNERVTVGEGDLCLDIAGVDDASSHRFGNGHGQDVGKALHGCPPDREVMLLAHQPKAALDAAKLGAGLVLSGHTHGGQIWPFGYLVRLTQPFLRGLSRYRDTYVYVSCGTGYWGPPMRVAAPSELTLLELRYATTKVA